MTATLNLDSWLVGFLDGRGSLMADTRGAKTRTTLQIKMRDDGVRLLFEIRDHLGLGTISAVGACNRRLLSIGNYYDAPAAQLCIRAAGECQQMADWFDEHPLQGKRQREVALWCQIVRLIEANGSSTTSELVYLNGQLKGCKENVPPLVEAGS